MPVIDTTKPVERYSTLPPPYPPSSPTLPSVSSPTSSDPDWKQRALAAEAREAELRWRVETSEQKELAAWRELSWVRGQLKEKELELAHVKNGGRGVAEGGSSMKGLRARALWDFDGESDKEMSLEKGDMLEKVEKTYENWWYAVSADSTKRGLFPSNYVELIHDDPQWPFLNRVPSPTLIAALQSASLD